MIEFSAKILGQLNVGEIGKQANFAMAKTLTQVARLAEKQIQEELASKLDRPTPWTIKSTFVRPANKKADVLLSYVGLKDRGQVKSAGSAAEVIGQNFLGGQRKFKRFEGALLSAGVLKKGQVVVPGEAAPLDQYGNVKRSFIVQMMSYLGVFGEQGYKANATAKRKQNLAKVGRSENGFKTISGVVYFISRGPGMWFGRMQHLPAGIWQKSGIHGIDVRPVFLFVDGGNYEKRIDILAIASTVHQDQAATLYSVNFRQAISTAKF